MSCVHWTISILRMIWLVYTYLLSTYFNSQLTKAAGAILTVLLMPLKVARETDQDDNVKADSEEDLTERHADEETKQFMARDARGEQGSNEQDCEITLPIDETEQAIDP